MTTPEPTPPPHHRGWPLVGALPGMATQGMAHVDALHATLGDIFRIDAGPQSTVLLYQPEHAHRVLVSQAARYAKQGTFWSSVRSLLGLGLPTSEGELWRTRRRMMNPQFRRARIDALGQGMVQTMAEQLDTWPTEGVIAGAPAISQITMAVIVRTMFGTGLSAAQAATVSEAMSFSLDHMMQKVVTDALPAWLPVPGRAAHRAAVGRIDAVIYGLLEARRAAPPDQTDLLGMMLAMRDDTSGHGLDDAALRDETMSLFIAGYETTAVTVAWAVARLATDVALYQRVADEVDAVLGDRRPEPADLERLAFTGRVFLEALRLDGPVFFLPRVAVEDDVIDGHRIDAGTMVTLMLSRIHRHPAHWPEPDRFDPDRFLPEASHGRHPCAWMPFGVGQRQCIGKHFATLEGTFLLAMLVQRYRFALADGTFPAEQLAMTRRPRGDLPLRLTRR